MKQILPRNSIGFFIRAFWPVLSAFMLGNLSADVEPAARVAGSSVEIKSSADGKGLVVDLRLLDATAVKATHAVDRAGKGVIPVVWTPFDEGTPNANCAWLIVIDCSNPARQRTVVACAEEVRSFLNLLPKGDAVMMASLARDLVTMATFEATPAQRETALANMKAEGDRSLSSLIYQNVKIALAAHLSGRPEARKCVVLLTDGKDETPGGPLKVTERRIELIAEARRLGIAVHTLGFAERAMEAAFFADLKEVSLKTDGLHFPAEVSTRQLPADTWSSLIGVMHSGGTAFLDLSAVTKTASIRLHLDGAKGRSAWVDIPKKMVEGMVPAESPAAPVVVPQDSTIAPPSPIEETKVLPIWAWCVGGGIVLGVIWLAARRERRESVVTKKTQSQMSHPPSMIVAEESEPESGTHLTAASRVPPIRLQLCDANQAPSVITENGARIGSGPHCDIVIKDTSVSDTHCLISMQNGQWVISELESATGIRVNGIYYHQASLSPNDVIEIGAIRLQVLV